MVAYQEFHVSFDEPGTKLAQLYWNGTNPTLVAEKDLVVSVVQVQASEEQEPEPFVPEEIQQLDPEEEPEKEVIQIDQSTTGFFGLGSLGDLGTAAPIGLVLILVIIGLFLFLSKRKKEEPQGLRKE